MDFGIWVKKIRTERGLEIRALAKMSGVDGSTISRIENLITETTLFTAFRISRALMVQLPELIQILIEDIPITIKEKEITTVSTVVTLHDVEDFVGSFHSYELEYCGRIAKSLNDIALDMGLRELKGVPLRDFTGEQIFYMLLIDSPIYQFEIKYPSSMKDDDILFNYQHFGVMILADATAFLDACYEKYKRINVGLNERSVTKISTNALNRLETSTFERIRLSDVILLDRQLGQNGTLIDMYWEVCRFNERFNPSRKRQKQPSESSQMLDNLGDSQIRIVNEHKYELAFTYVIISRWYQYLKGPYAKWNKFLE